MSARRERRNFFSCEDVSTFSAITTFGSFNKSFRSAIFVKGRVFFFFFFFFFFFCNLAFLFFLRTVMQSYDFQGYLDCVISRWFSCADRSTKTRSNGLFFQPKRLLGKVVNILPHDIVTG